MTDNIQNLLKISPKQLDAINAVLLDPNSRVMQQFLQVVAKYGTPEEINHKHRESRKLENLFKQIDSKAPEYIQDLNWLMEQRDKHAFISVADYRRKALGEAANTTHFKDDYAVTLEVSALQYFPWVRVMAERAIRDQTLMPGRFFLGVAFWIARTFDGLFGPIS